MFLEIASYLGGSRSHLTDGIMKDFPSCFGESGVQVATDTSRVAPPQNLVICVYHYHSQAFSGFITVTWIKNLMAQGLSIGIETQSKESLAKVDIKPWLFSKRKGVKSLVVNSIRVDIYWDLSCAKFGSGPEPLEGFYVAVAFNQELCLLVGDLESEAYKKVDPAPFASKATFVAKKEDIFGKRLYSSKAQLCGKGRLHDIMIEYDANESLGKCLTISIDGKPVLEVARLKWKFRGNQTILVDGVSVEVYWDVYSWLFGSLVGNAIFLFRSHVGSESSALSWKGLQRFKDTPTSLTHGFSLVLCAWKNE
ncbi:hypothetical protein ACS0TY_007585 [Phlomoides rotata]